eukprot:SAG31_NODE_1452_length_8286_cov_6.329547_9_plen_32_part_00
MFCIVILYEYQVQLILRVSVRICLEYDQGPG